MTALARGWLARAWSSLHHTAPSGRLGAQQVEQMEPCWDGQAAGAP
jgi:hypothetical protein